MKPNETLWTLEPHSEGKHRVLEAYLKAWFPILAKYDKRILFIDGFAGPGEYKDGQKGSPLLALDTALNHEFLTKLRDREIIFAFIEADPGRAHHLEALVEERRSRMPNGWSAAVINGKFDAHLTRVLDELDKEKQRLAPAFVMIDPFGVSDTPMSVIRRIMKNEKAEVYVSFMYEFINRLKATPEFEAHLDGLYGTEDWRRGLDIADGRERKTFFYDLYEQQLRAAGAQHVIRFELYEGNRLVYAIFFGTKNWLGADRMKQAIWKVDPFGGFAFKGTRNLTLDLGGFDPSKLRRVLEERFRGKGWVTIEQIEEFVGSDQTDFHTGQIKKAVLTPMEDEGAIEVDAATRKRRRTFPKGTRLRVL